MSDSSVMKWYAVRAIGGQENKVKAYIENEIARLGLSDFVSQVLVPTEKVIQIRNGKKYHKEKVYFPGYIMVEANLSGEVPHVIKSVTGVIGFLGELYPQVLDNWDLKMPVVGLEINLEQFF